MLRFGLGFVLRFALILPVRCQIYTFEDEPIPEARSLVTRYAFYVYSYQDAPQRTFGQTSVGFSGLQASPAVASDYASHNLEVYEGLQVSIIPYDVFWNLKDQTRFCSTAVDVDQGKARNENLLLDLSKGDLGHDWYSYSVPWTKANEVATASILHQTSVYVLVVSNCGNYSAGTISGSIIVKHSHGYLPGNEYQKLPFYGRLLIAYIGISLLWALLLMRRCSEVFRIQWCIGGVVLLGLCEASMWWAFYFHWNTAGSRSTMLFCAALLMTVLKTISSYMLVLVASMGWGITRPFLDGAIIRKIVLLSVAYIVMDIIKQTCVSYRHSHSISAFLVLLCVLPVGVLNGVIFYWIIVALSTIIEHLKEQGQTYKLALFHSLWRVIVAAMFSACASVTYQMFDLSSSIARRWLHEWVYTDAISHLIFLAVLLAMIYMWAPRESSKRYQYSQVEDATQQSSEVVWGEDEDEEESFWATTKGSSKPDPDASTIGSSQ